MSRRARHPAYGTTEYTRYYRWVRKVGPECHLCGHPGANSVDHLTPVSHFPPGTDPKVISHPSNLAPAHLICNQKRSNQTIPGARRAVHRDNRY